MFRDSGPAWAIGIGSRTGVGAGALLSADWMAAAAWPSLRPMQPPQLSPKLSGCFPDVFANEFRRWIVSLPRGREALLPVGLVERLRSCGWSGIEPRLDCGRSLALTTRQATVQLSPSRRRIGRLRTPILNRCFPNVLTNNSEDGTSLYLIAGWHYLAWTKEGVQYSYQSLGS